MDYGLQFISGANNFTGVNVSQKAILVRWQKIQSEFQHYIAAREMVILKLPSERIIGHSDEYVMSLFCKKAEEKRAGVFKASPPFIYEDGAEFLTLESKWKTSR